MRFYIECERYDGSFWRAESWPTFAKALARVAFWRDGTYSRVGIRVVA